MTLITTLITRHCCVLASDSRLSYAKTPRDLWPPDEPKLISAPRWRGAMAYWGTAFTGSWNTKDFSLEAVATAPEGHSAEDLAHTIAERLNHGVCRAHAEE
jgi:hypothetical protein